MSGAPIPKTKNKKKAPTPKAAKEKATRLHSLYVRLRDGKCTRCGEFSDNLQCAHIVPRGFVATRCEPDNGAALCPRCHMHVDHVDAYDKVLWAVKVIGEERYAELRAMAYAHAKNPVKMDWVAIAADLSERITRLQDAA